MKAIVFELADGTLLVAPDGMPYEIVHREPVRTGGTAARELIVRESGARCLSEAAWRVEQRFDELVRKAGD